MCACSGFQTCRINISKLTIYQNKKFSQFIRPIDFQGQPSGDYDSWTLLAKVALTTPPVTCLVLHSQLFFGFPFLLKNKSYGPLIFDQSLHQLLCCQLKGAHFTQQGGKTRLSPRDLLRFTPWQCQFICCQSREFFKAIWLWISSQHPDHTSNWCNWCNHFCVL
jgi:hypothetical protein